MHFCADELFMLMMVIPFFGAFVRRMHAWYLRKFPKHAHICHDHRDAPGEMPSEFVTIEMEAEGTEEERQKEIDKAISDAESEGPHHQDKTFDELIRPEDLPYKFLNKKNEK